VDVNSSAIDCTLERDAGGEPALRLGLQRVAGLSAAGAERLVMARAASGAFTGVQQLAEQADLAAADLAALAAAGALRGIAGHRYRAGWAVSGIEPTTPLWREIRVAEALPMLRAPSEGEDIVADYASQGLTLGRHPLALLRPRLSHGGVLAATALRERAHGDRVRVAGLVITRQRPGSAHGVIFVTLEDETGYVNLIVWQSVAERQPRVLLQSSLLGVRGEVQRQGEVLHVIAGQLEDLSGLLGRLRAPSRDFH
jgi:error-prone DNA polymerase